MKLFYRKYGKGHPIVILHGLFGMSDNWVTFGKELSGNYEVFIPDQRNHGRSPHSDDFDYNILKDDIIKFIEQNKLEDVILIGHSMGGKVAMSVALNMPALISKLIVLDISPASKTPATEILLIIKAIQDANLEALNSREEIKDKLSKIINKKRIVEFLLKNIRRGKDDQFYWKFNDKAITENLSAIAAGIETDKKFLKPALFIGGDRSPYLGGENIYQIFDNFPVARIEIINNAGHWLHVDAPEGLLSMIVGFIN